MIALDPSDRSTQDDSEEIMSVLAAGAGGEAPSAYQTAALRATSSESVVQVASVHVAASLSSDQAARLVRALERHFGGKIGLDVELDPSVIGGAWVRVGDTVIDGSTRGRLEALSEHLCARCRIMLAGGRV